VGFAKAVELGGPQKAIIFTESRRTQDYLVRLLCQNGYDGQLVLFNGTNADAQSREIYAAWADANKGTDRATGSRTADTRAALVEHFRNKASIMIATEAAAEGINLQFCSMVVNYDLPWNPQRIEQRIGRCHRYGQKYDVVVVNFLNQNCRTEEEIETEFEALRAEMDTQITTTMDDTRRKLLENFDAEVHDRLKMNLDRSRDYVSRYERMLWTVTRYELAKLATFDDGYLSFILKSPPSGVPVTTGAYFLTKQGLEGHRYRLGHPLAQHVLAQAGTRSLGGAHLAFDYSGWRQKALSIEPFVGTSGIMAVRKLSISGSDAQDHILIAAGSWYREHSSREPCDDCKI
jgi:Helicase conserved C-terminal domain